MNANERCILRLENVTKVFTTDEVETHAVSRVSLTVEEGEFVAVAGPSGSGKSTLLAIMGLLETPTSGRVSFRGAAVSDLPASARTRVRRESLGFVFQAFNLIGDLSVIENVALPLAYRKVASGERLQRAREALQRVGMGHRRNHHPAQLSGGEQQRVAVARAVVGRPALLLADEPTGNLDSANAREVMGLLRDLHREGTTLCMVSHDPRFVESAGRVVNLLDGRIVPPGASTGIAAVDLGDRGEPRAEGGTR